MKNTMIAATCGFALVGMAHAQEPAAGNVINLAGSNAFRSAVDATIVSIMGSGARTAYLSGANITGTTNATRSIYKGTINGTQYTIRTNWNGSAGGVVALADQTNLAFFPSATTTALASAGGLAQASGSENGIANLAFSDVEQAAAGRPSASFAANAQVGVVPFVFVAGEGTPAAITNITDQQFTYIWSNGGSTAQVLTGNAADSGFFLYPTGRSATSGTRISTLSETRYGRGNSVLQFNSTFSGENLTGTPTSIGNTGLPGGLEIATLLGKTPNTATYSFVSYIGIPDANIAVSNGARILTYNGVAYSEDKVRTGQYTFWGYQQMYRRTTAAAEVVTFDGLLRNNISSNLGTAGIALDTMLVDRIGGDGGNITEK